MNSSNVTQTLDTNPPSTEPIMTAADYVFYYIIMFLILVIGLPGNILAIIVLRHRDHRNKTSTPLLINIAVVDLFILICGYPMAVVSAHVNGSIGDKQSPRCSWSAFINASTGVASIATHVAMSVLMYKRLKSLEISRKLLTGRQSWALIFATWVYGIVVASPPFFGWSRFVPHASGMSCCPDWMSRDPRDISYIGFLVVMAYFLPIGIICTFYSKTYKFIRTSNMPQTSSLQERRRQREVKTLTMLLCALATFTLSWTPYCIVSLTATFNGDYKTSPSENLATELMAKASVIYNPVVFVLANKSFRQTFLNRELYRPLLVYVGRWTSEDENGRAQNYTGTSQEGQGVGENSNRANPQST